MLRKRILILEPYGRLKHVARIRDLFLSFDFEVKKLGAGDKHKHPRSCVIVPDTKGINCNVSHFFDAGNPVVPFNVKPQDQLVEYWRLNTAGYYINNKVGICGIGVSSSLIFAELLKGKLTSGRDGVSPTGDIHKLAYWEKDNFVATAPLCAGYTGKMDEDFVAFIDKHFFSGDVPVPVMEELPKPPIAPKPKALEW